MKNVELKEKPLYPFCYGLTYSRIEIRDVEAVLDDDKNLILNIAVKNTGVKPKVAEINW